MRLRRSDARQAAKGLVRWPRPTALPVRDASADFVLCALTLGHLSRSRRSDTRVGSCSGKPGGTLIVHRLPPRGRPPYVSQRGRLYELENHPVLCADDLRCGVAGAGESLEARFGGRSAKSSTARDDPSCSSPVQSPRGAARALDARMTLDLPGCKIRPGLINAHDHLEFNLFPRLGIAPLPQRDGVGARYLPSRSQLRFASTSECPSARALVGRDSRICSAALRPCAITIRTTPRSSTHDFPVRVVRRFGWAHSLAFEPDVARTPPADAQELAVHRPLRRRRRTRAAADENCRRSKLGVLDQRHHDRARSRADRSRHEPHAGERGASLIWCPTRILSCSGGP